MRMLEKLFLLLLSILDHFLILLNFSKLEAFVHNLNPKPDIIAITETWIHIIYLDYIAILVIMFSYQIVEKLLKVVELVSMSNVAINLLLFTIN